nr:MAG TPA: hypothetical protein [Caudoviricetes sp.]
MVTYGQLIFITHLSDVVIYSVNRTLSCAAAVS